MIDRRQFLYLCSGLLVGCSAANREPDFTVVMQPGSTFEPASLTVPIGSTVAWQNRTDHTHTVTTDPAKAQMPERIMQPPNVQPFDSGNIFAGERWIHTFDTAGTYTYFCRYHELEEMLGAITVSA